MKNFTKQFMKLTMVFAAINAASLVSAYAQETDYIEINTRNETTASSQAASRSNEVVDFLFATKLGRINLPKNRKLTSSEKEQKQLLECVVKFIEKRKGLYEGPAIINEILMQAMDSDKLTADSYTLGTTTERCWTTYNHLTNFKQRETEEGKLKSVLNKLPGSSPAEGKTARFITRQYKNKFDCIANEASASVAVGVGLGAGVNHLKCLNYAGVVRNYVGPKIEFVGGFGAKIEYAKKDNFDDFTSGLIAGSEGSGGSADLDNIVLGVGAGNNSGSHGDYASYHREAQMVGLGVLSNGSFTTINVRVFNGLRNWSFVLDQLK